MTKPDRPAPTASASNVRKQFSVFAAHGAAAQPSFGGTSRRWRRLLRRLLWLRALTRTGRVVSPGKARLADAEAAERTCSPGPCCSHCALRPRPQRRPRARQLRWASADAAVPPAARAAPAQTRTQVVFGVGNPNADLMFVGEAPGFHEDQQGVPFVGQAGKLLDRLLAGIGLYARRRLHRERPKCRPPATATRCRTRSRPASATSSARSSSSSRASSRRSATSRRSCSPASRSGITRVHGQEQEVTLGGRAGAALSALPPGGGAVHAGDAEGARAGLRAHPGPARRARPRRRPAPPPVEARRRRRAAPVQLGLF